MEQGLILLVAALTVFVAAGVQGTAHLSFANNTQVNITRTGCGVTKLCVETPDRCHPTGNNTCLFASVVASTPMAPNGTNLSIALRGNSMGYIALGLTVNASVGSTMLFVCAQNKSDNGTFFFRTVQRNNTDGNFTATETRVMEIRSSVKDDVIQCEFNVPSVNATNTRSSDATTFTILLGTGSLNGMQLSPLNITLRTSPLNIANPQSNVLTTAAPTTTGASSVFHPHAGLLLMSVLALFAVQRA